jgi:single-strand selective monofunctional uracil DNA glycosylase
MAASTILTVSQNLATEVEALTFSPPVTHVYNPLIYAWESYSEYIRRYAEGTKRVLFMGMNPGPWGMAQTGVPFGEIAAVKDWIGINRQVGSPEEVHPKRPIEGFACEKSEVSGRRLWGLMSEKFGTADAFFADHFVANYCPLAFMEKSGRNRTPDKLPAEERSPLFRSCDRGMRRIIEELQPQYAVGVGRFAEKRLQSITAGLDLSVTTILHPSPASPRANRDWAGDATRSLEEAGIW